MQKLCTDEQWLTRHWGSLRKRRMTSTNGRKLSQSLQLMLKHRYRNYKSCTQSKRQSKSSSLKTFSAANDHSCMLDFRALPKSQTQGTLRVCAVKCVAGCSNAMESQPGDKGVHRTARSCGMCSGAWKNPQVSDFPPLVVVTVNEAECSVVCYTRVCTGGTCASRGCCQIWPRHVEPQTSPGIYICTCSKAMFAGK